MSIKQRGVAASRAYLERIGQEVLEPGREPIPGGVDILSIDDHALVATLVRVRQRPTENAPVSGQTLDAALRNTIAHRRNSSSWAAIPRPRRVPRPPS